MRDRKKNLKKIDEVPVLEIINETLSPKKKEKLFEDFCNSCQITKDGMYKVIKRVHINDDLKRIKILANHITNGSIDELFRMIYPNNNNTAKF